MSTHYERLGWIEDNRVQQKRQYRIRKGFYVAGKILTIPAVTGILLGAGMMDSPSLTAPIMVMATGMVFAILAIICNKVSCVEE